MPPKRLTPRGEAAPPVEPIVTGATLPPKSPLTKRTPTAKPGARYIRNLHHIPARITLASGRRIELEPRGRRGDSDIVNVEEQQDPKFLANHLLIFEIISIAEAELIISKQQTNASQRQHTLWDHLRSENDQPYEQRHARIEEAFEKQGIVVGSVSEPADDGSGSSQNLGYSRTAGPQITTAPGSIGDPATEYMQSVPDYVAPEEYHEFLLWKQFREERARAAQEVEQDQPTTKAV